MEYTLDTSTAAESMVMVLPRLGHSRPLGVPPVTVNRPDELPDGLPVDTGPRIVCVQEATTFRPALRLDDYAVAGGTMHTHWFEWEAKPAPDAPGPGRGGPPQVEPRSPPLRHYSRPLGAWQDSRIWPKPSPRPDRGALGNVFDTFHSLYKPCAPPAPKPEPGKMPDYRSIFDRIRQEFMPAESMEPEPSVPDEDVDLLADELLAFTEHAKRCMARGRRMSADDRKTLDRLLARVQRVGPMGSNPMGLRYPPLSIPFAQLPPERPRLSRQARDELVENTSGHLAGLLLSVSQAKSADTPTYPLGPVARMHLYFTDGDTACVNMVCTRSGRPCIGLSLMLTGATTARGRHIPETGSNWGDPDVLGYPVKSIHQRVGTLARVTIEPMIPDLLPADLPAALRAHTTPAYRSPMFVGLNMSNVVWNEIPAHTPWPRGVDVDWHPTAGAVGGAGS